MDPALLFAIYRRLVGYPLDNRGRPQLGSDGKPRNIEGSWGLRLPSRKTGASQAAQGDVDLHRFGARGYEAKNYVQVPVFLEGVDARRWTSVFPSASFMMSDIQGGEAYVYDLADGEDGIGADTGTQTITNNVTGYTYEATDQRRTRKHPEPWDVFVTVTLRSREPFELAMLERALLILFGKKGAIQVEQLDGSHRVIDYVQERYAVGHEGEANDPDEGIGGERSAFLKSSLTYRFETSLDNSVVGFGTDDFTTQQMVSERLLEIYQGVEALAADSLEFETVRLEDLTP
jgi:hypothetical protein